MDHPASSFDAFGAPRTPPVARLPRGEYVDPISDSDDSRRAARATTDVFESHSATPAGKAGAPVAQDGNAGDDDGTDRGTADVTRAEELRSTHAVNTAYSRRVMIGGDRALVVHFTHNPSSSLSASEQLLTVARVAIPALCNYLYFRAGKLAVIYFGKSRTASGLKTGIVGGDDMKQKILRYLTAEIWPPLRTDVPDDSGAARDENAVGESRPTASHPDAAVAARQATLDPTELEAVDSPTIIPPPAMADSQPSTLRASKCGPLGLCALNGNPMQVLVYLKEGAGDTKYVKLVIANIEKLHFDVVDTREEKYRWENRKLHIRMLDSLETQKAIYSYSEYEQALKEACQFAVQHRDETAEEIIAECEAAAREVDVDVADADDTTISPTLSPQVTTVLTNGVGRVGNATTNLLFAERQMHGAASRPVSPAARSTSPSLRGTFPRSTPLPTALTLGPAALVSSPSSNEGSPGGPVQGQVHCVVVKDHYYSFYQPMSLPESATLDYKSYFFNTAKEITDRAVKFMCGFLNAYGHGKLVVGVHEIRGAVSNASPAPAPKSAAASSPSTEGSGRQVPDQLVVGAHLSFEDIAALVNDLSVQLAHCVPPIPAEIVHINLVPVRLPSSNAAPTSTTPALGPVAAAPPPLSDDVPSPVETLHIASPPVVSPTTAPPSALLPPAAAADRGHFPAVSAFDGPTAGDATEGTSPPFAPTTPTPKPNQQLRRQRVLVFYEPPVANYFNVFQQKANFAVRALARHGYSLAPLDLPVPRLPDEVVKSGERALLPSTFHYDKAQQPGPLHGVVYPIPRDWIAQCYAIVPFAPSAAAQAAIFAAEAASQRDISSTPAESAFGTQDVVEVFDGTMWTPYDEDASRIVTVAKAKGETKVSIKVSKRTYDVDLVAMTQVNAKTKTVRSIRIRRFGSVADASDPDAHGNSTLAKHEFEVIRGLNLQKSQRQCIVWANGVALPELYIIDISVDVRRLDETHPLRSYRGKFFNGWPSIPLWDPLSHCVRRAPRAYPLVLQRRQHIDGLLPDAQREWFQRVEVCLIIASFAPTQSQRALRMVCHAFSDAIDVVWGRDVVRTLCDDAVALMRDSIVPVPFEALRATQYALRREFGAASDGTAAVLAHRYHALHMATQLTGPAPAVKSSRGSRRRATVGMSPSLLRADRPSTLPLILCWTFEAIGAIPAPYPHVPVPLQLQTIRLAPNLVTLLMAPASDDTPWMLVPSVVLDLNDGLLRFFPTGSFGTPAHHSSPTTAQEGSAMGMMRTDSASTSGSTPSALLETLRVLCGAMCDVYSAASALALARAAAMQSHRSMSVSAGMDIPPAQRRHHRAGVVAPVSNVVPVKMAFVDASVALNPTPWTIQTLLVWLQLVAKDPMVRFHGAGAGCGSTMAMMCDVVHEACVAHLRSPVTQTTHKLAGHDAMGSRVSSSMLVTPQPAQHAGFPGGAFDSIPGLAVEPASPLRARDATAPSLEAVDLGGGPALTPQVPSPLFVRSSSTKSGAISRGDHFPAAPLNFTNATEPSPASVHIAAGQAQPAASVRPQPLAFKDHAPVSGATSAGGMVSPATSTRFASTFDCPLHRAELEWAMW